MIRCIYNLLGSTIPFCCYELAILKHEKVGLHFITAIRFSVKHIVIQIYKHIIHTYKNNNAYIESHNTIHAYKHIHAYMHTNTLHTYKRIIHTEIHTIALGVLLMEEKSESKIYFSSVCAMSTCN